MVEIFDIEKENHVTNGKRARAGEEGREANGKKGEGENGEGLSENMGTAALPTTDMIVFASAPVVKLALESLVPGYANFVGLFVGLFVYLLFVCWLVCYCWVWFFFA